MERSSALRRLAAIATSVLGPTALSTAHGFARRGPPNRQTAPPGHYMLFVLNQNNTPSIARIVRLE